MQITRIENLYRGRVKIFLEDNKVLILYHKETGDIDLKEGTDISVEKYNTIREEVVLPRAKKRAMFILEKMDRTEFQLKEKLWQGYDEETVEEVIAYIKRLHYLDDFRYACNYIRCRSKGKGRRQLEMELLQRGVGRETVRQAMEEEYQDEREEEGIKMWIGKKEYNPESADTKEKGKMYRFLIRKGFRPDDIMHYI